MNAVAGAIRRAGLAGLLLLLSGALCHAQTVYVNGYREVMLRSGPSVEHRIIAVLRTGNDMEVLGEDGDYNLISLPDGRQGYVLKSFLTEEAPPERRVEDLSATVQTQAAELEDLRARNQRLTARTETLVEELQRSRGTLERIQRESSSLERDTRLWWFGAGAGVLLLGWIMGMTRLRLRRKARARSFT